MDFSTLLMISRSFFSSMFDRKLAGALLMPWPMKAHLRRLVSSMIRGYSRMISALRHTVPRMPILSISSIMRQRPTRLP